MTTISRETHRWVIQSFAEPHTRATYKVCVDCGAKNRILAGVDYNTWLLNGKETPWCPTPKQRMYQPEEKK